MWSLKLLLTLTVAAFFASCGQDPAFLELEGQGGKAKSRSSGGSVDDFGNTADQKGDDSLDGDENYGEDLDGDGWPDEIGGGDGDNGLSDGGNNGGIGNNNGNSGGNGNNPITPDDLDIPDANEEDKKSIAKCMNLWGPNNPFGTSVDSFEKIYASVTIGGSGSPINDTVRTENPKLILVVAGIAVDSNVTYNMLNPNGYYCIKVGVNVETNLTANIHCNARVAQTNVSVNVGSNGDPLSSVGVNVNSNTQVNIVRPTGDQCRI